MELGPILAFQLFNGIVWGLIFALIALGLSLTFGLMQLMNVAHSSLYMLGAVFTALLITKFGFGFWTSIVISTILVGCLGAVLNQTVLVRVVRADPATGLLATAGVLLVIENSTLATFGSVPVSVDPPFDLTLPVLGFGYPVYRLIVAALAIMIITATFLFLRKTTLGLWMRAVPLQRDLASLSGVSSKRVNLVTVTLGSVLAGVAGGLVTPIAGAHFQMGESVLAAAFMVIIVGGAGSLWGAVVVAIGLGVVRGLASTFVTPTEAEIISLLALLPILLVRPNGIFENRYA